MGLRPALLAWQWSTYSRNHTRRLNLAVHGFAVPAFGLGVLGAVIALFAGAWLSAPVSLAMSLVAFAMQGIAHKLEPEPPIPFDGPLDAIARVLVEQFVTFPRFVMTGAFARAWSAGA